MPLPDAIAEKVLSSLKQQGFVRTVNGEEYAVSFSKIGYVPDKFIALWVDIKHLPPRVALDRLMSQSTLHTLSTVLGGLEVRVINTQGLMYVVILSPELPSKVFLGEPTIKDDFAVPIGRARGGDVWMSINNMGHTLIGGVTQSGKTSLLKTMLSVIGNNPLIDTYIIDPKQVGFAKMAHLAKIVSSVEDATALMHLIYGELERRKGLFSEARVETFAEWRSKGNADKMLVVVIDEFTSIALNAGLDSEFYTTLKLLSSQAASFGIHLFLSTQNPKAEVLNTLIRSNCDTRIAFRVATKRDSNTILDTYGAEKIKQGQKGRFLFRHSGKLVEMQAFLMEEE